MLVTLLLLSLVSAGHVHDLHARHEENEHVAHRRLPDTWYHKRDHPVYDLFRRDTAASFPVVGSDDWKNSLPPFTPNGAATPDTSKLPQAWVDALNAAVARGAIPNIPQSSSPDVGTPVYPNNLDPNGAQVCSSYGKCKVASDHWDVPAGTLALNFDDGPTSFTPKLLDFLDQHNEVATHFMIGYAILQNPNEFMAALNANHDLAVHTWSHPQMTTKSNLEVISELGWSMFIIYQSTNGRVPKYWRPPTGDADNRIRAIAQEVFGLEMVLWNQDTEDWSLTTTSPLTTPALIASNMTAWLTGPKTPGLMILEHELSEQSVDAFIAAYPQMKSNGWQTNSAARLLSSSAYRNAAGPSGAVTPAGMLDFGGSGGLTSTSGSLSSGSVIGQTSAASQTSSTKSSSITAVGSLSATNSASGSSGTSAPLATPTSGALRLEAAMWTTLFGVALGYMAS
ncbi:hypothetical protein C8J56DRAFT_941568 [Mycena floridula]|nr:hypothetical protein C8J56DRAFT_941568 [Mycena floridula]